MNSLIKYTYLQEVDGTEPPSQNNEDDTSSDPDVMSDYMELWCVSSELLWACDVLMFRVEP